MGKTRAPSVFNLPFAEELYADYLRDPSEVPEDWRRYFAQLPSDGAGRVAATADAQVGDAALQDRLLRLVRAYRVRGHLVAELDPLGRKRPDQLELDPAYYGITEDDLERVVESQAVHTEHRPTLRALIESLKRTYCGSIGVQYMHIDDLGMKEWLEDKMERSQNRISLTREEQHLILCKLTDAVTFEEFIQTKYIGAKSFSLEGAESLIPLLTNAIELAGDSGTGEIVLAMAHRGRLNVLANVMAKAPGHIFHEFDDKTPEKFLGRGDVKYHLGYSHDWTTVKGNQVHLTLCFNPSHLEFVNTVALGRTRAKQDRAGDRDRRAKLAILIHGDSAFAGEGIVQETLNLSELEGYRTGGTVHIVINNQIGFTTPPEQTRSCTYATDVAKMLQIPIFHVNGEDPEAVAQVVHVALEFLRNFQKDVVIDMYAYRRHGHNEGDEPSFTQPILYRAIKERKSVREGYLEHLLKMGGLTREEADRILADCRGRYEKELERVREPDYKLERTDWSQGIWKGYVGGPEAEVEDVDTAIPREQLVRLLYRMTELPTHFTPHPKIQRLLRQRRQMAAGEIRLDWGAADCLAFATLAIEGARVRMTGQDSERGTFSHRHAVLNDYHDGKKHSVLSNLAPNQATVEIHNSPLSEAGVLGFEYGYSLDCPDGLVVWEAQFGDFSNAAQVITDQFISSAEDKWRRLSGLVMLLPHAFEGMGPEHSSARLERYLNLCAEHNLQVVQPSTPAQHFHALRRQVARNWRKPLIVMTPKSLLRHRESTSVLEDFATGRFQRVIADDRDPGTATERVLLCSGKIYFELHAKRRELERNDVAIVRLEQFYPLPEAELQAALASYDEGTPVIWVQDEPENMGVWRFLHARFCEDLFGRFLLYGLFRPESASPATGSHASHKLEQSWLLSDAFEREPITGPTKEY